MAALRDGISGLWRRPWWALAGALCGLLVAPTINYLVGSVATAYYALSPVAVITGEVAYADADQILVHLRAIKRHAPDCKFLALRARTLDVGGEYELADIQRIDRPGIGEALPPGNHDIGYWRIVPRSDGVAVVVAPMYDCGGRVVWGTPATMRLPAGGKVS